MPTLLSFVVFCRLRRPYDSLTSRCRCNILQRIPCDSELTLFSSSTTVGVFQRRFFSYIGDDFAFLDVVIPVNFFCCQIRVRPVHLAYLFAVVSVSCQCRSLIKSLQSVSGSIFLCSHIAVLSNGRPVSVFRPGASNYNA